MDARWMHHEIGKDRMKQLLRLLRPFPRVSWLLRRPKGKLGASERPMVDAVSLLLFAVFPLWCGAQQINSSLPVLSSLAAQPLISGRKAVVLTNATPASLEGALASGATVTFGFDGTIPLTNAIVVTTNATLDATGRSITLDGQSRVRHFVLTNGLTLRLINLTLANGRFVGSDGQTNQPGDPAFGGSIYNAGGTLELTGCKLINNQALGGNGGLPVSTNHPAIPGEPKGTDGGPAYGGAIYSSNGGIRMTGCLLSGNTCAGGKNTQAESGGFGGDDFGGAVYLTNATMSMFEVIFTNNTVRSTAPLGSGFGGAVFEVGSAVTISNSVFVSNQALAADLLVGSIADAQGGALFHRSGLLTMDGTLLRGNVATGGSSAGGTQLGSMGGLGYAGALYNDVSGEIRISNSSFVRNQANGGVDWSFANGGSGTAYGGAMVTSGELVAINCTFAENRATGGSSPTGISGWAYGGAIVAGAGSPVSLVNVTFAGNAVARGQDCGCAPVQLQGGSI
jgi:fibronectin-binding autotransporter adhesin